MTIREYYTSKFDNKILKLTVIIFIVFFLFSAFLYLKKIKTSLQSDIKQLEIAREKITKTYAIKKDLDRIMLTEIKKSDLTVTEMIDSFNKNFPEAKFEISTPRSEGQEIVFPFSIRGDNNFKRFTEIVSFLHKQSYPVCIINSVTLKEKDNLVSFEIKGELRIIK